jgi:hypothetical protein
MSDRIDLIKQLFLEREQEVDAHLSFIKSLIDSKASKFARVDADGNVTLSEYVIDRNTLKTLIASGFLHIYNLVESTMTNTLDAIHVHLMNEEIQFEALNGSIKQLCFKNFKKTSAADVRDYIYPIARGMLHLGYDKKRLFSGNIHANIIKDKAKEYGFEIAQHDRSQSKNGDRLELVLERRNDLAHGNLSFSECGSEASIDELIEIKNEACIYLSAVIEGVKNYLIEEDYLEKCFT